MSVSYASARSPEPTLQAKEFKASMQALSTAVVSIVQLLSQPP
jgi:hypothetical protein